MIKKALVYFSDSGKPLLQPENLVGFPELLQYVKTFTYLKENDQNFWTKLIYKLPHKRKSDFKNNEQIVV